MFGNRTIKSCVAKWLCIELQIHFISVQFRSQLNIVWLSRIITILMFLRIVYFNNLFNVYFIFASEFLSKTYFKQLLYRALLSKKVLFLLQFSFFFIFGFIVTLIACPYIFFLFSNNSLIENYFNLVDNTSLLFSLLTSFLIPFCVYSGRGLKNYVFYCFVFLLMEINLIALFLTPNLLLFYCFFEVVTFLMFIVLLNWGYEVRRSLASFYLFYYTFAASMLFLIGILSIYYLTDSLNFFFLQTFDFTDNQQILFWWLFFFAFAVKIPMYPFHIWLPEAHVEAPTGGSILLAGILLKLGFYGFFRFSLTLFPLANQLFMPVVFTLIILGMIHAMLVSLRQIDAKRIVAYSSIAHMNFALLGLFAWTLDGVGGSLLVMLGHGLIASGLFFLIGVLYRRYGTRLLLYYSGLVHAMPFFSIVFFFYILGNVAFPLTFNFPGELLLFLTISTKSKLLALLSMPVIILNLINSFLLFIRICFGNLVIYIEQTVDLVFWEFTLNIFLVVYIIGFGLSPQLIFNLLLT